MQKKTGVNGRLLKEKKTNCFHETLVALKIILIKAHAQKLKDSLHAGLEYPTTRILTQRTRDKTPLNVPLKAIIQLCDHFLPGLWRHHLIHILNQG